MTTRCRRYGQTPALRAAHESFLAETPRRRRGDVDVETAVAAAKLNDAQTLEDARAWLELTRTARRPQRPGADRHAGSPAGRGGPGERRGAAERGLRGRFAGARRHDPRPAPAQVYRLPDCTHRAQDASRLRRRPGARRLDNRRDPLLRRLCCDHDADPVRLRGADSVWTGHRLNPQRRDDGSIPLKSIARRHRAHTALGIITLFAAMLISPSLIVWMSPTIFGLIFSIPLSWASGNLSLGLAMRRIGLLRTPEETSPPAVVERSNALAAELALTGGDHDDALQAIWADPALRAAHESFLAETPRRRRGDIDVETAVAAAKLNDAQTLADARGWLELARTARRPQRPGADRDAGSPAGRGDPGERRGAAECGLRRALSAAAERAWPRQQVGPARSAAMGSFGNLRAFRKEKTLQNAK